MASEASWQTGIDAEIDGSVSDDQRAGQDALWTKSSYQPLDQHTIESLLQRLVDRFEESERLYGAAIEDLHLRLDQLSQTTQAARQTSQDVDSFDRLQTEVRDLAQRLEPEASTPLENFERLGRALAGGLRGDGEDGRSDGFDSAPEPSPFAKALMASKPRSRLAPDLDIEEEFEPPAFAPAYAAHTPPSAATEPRPDFDRQLVAMANRLEQSIETAMPTGTIEALNTRLDVIGHKVAQAFDASAGSPALDHVESHIADMGRQLAHAEAQLGRIEGVEEHLRKLIVRLDQKDATLEPARIASEQAQDIAAKAAHSAAQRVADDTKQTAERLDAMQRQLTAIGQTSRLSGDKVIRTLEAFHDRLNQLARNVERPASTSPAPRPPFAAGGAVKPPFARSQPDDAARAAPAKPPQTENAETRRRADASDTGGDANAEGSHTIEQARAVPSVFKGAAAVAGSVAPATTAKPLDEKPLNAAPDDLVAAARQAAQAAAARAEERAGQRSKRAPASTEANAPSTNRWRPLLIVIAAGLLVISALLLYGRLGTKAEPEQTPSPATSPPGAAAQPDQDRSTAVPRGPQPGPAENREQPQPQLHPKAGSTPANRTTGRTEVGAASNQGIVDPADRLASGVALPPGVTFSGSY